MKALCLGGGIGGGGFIPLDWDDGFFCHVFVDQTLPEYENSDCSPEKRRS